MRMKNTIKDFFEKIPIANRIFTWILDTTRPFRAWLHEVFPLYREYVSHANSVFLVLTPEHGNLGDHAIAKAIKEMLLRLDMHIVEIPTSKLLRLRELGWLKIMNRKRILINGGGNLGTLWFNIEQLQRDIIISNPQSTIFIMPNTICYEDSDWGRNEFIKSKDIYNSHPKLYLFAREKTSYRIMRSAYQNVTLMPDMVLSLNECINDRERKGCLLCLRSDRERIRSDEQERIIRHQAATLFGSAVCDTDMVAGHRILINQRESELQGKFAEFSGAELVITDRLHGMIFCAITGTPCIVIDSKSPKVRGCYEWIKDLDYIQFVDNVSEIAAAYYRIPKGKHIYDNTYLMPYFNELVESIKRLLA